jgi:hypothetical protein
MISGRRIIVFARAPRIGHAKRRLASDIGIVAATRFYRACLASTLRAAKRAGGEPILSLAEASDARWRWPHRADLYRQIPGDIGERMHAALVAAAPTTALLIGSDIPGLKPAHFAYAFRALAGHELIIGPARDGGFWLIGMSGPAYRRRALLSQAFKDVRWSSPNALADMLANLGGRAVALAATLRDIDTGADYRGWRGID